MLGSGRFAEVVMSGVAHRLAALAVLATLMSGCVGTPNATSTSTSTSTRSAIGSALAPSPSAAPSVRPAESSPAPTPTARPIVLDPLPNVPQAPSGTWKSIAWTKLPATPAFGAQVAHDPWDPKAGAPNTTLQVFGWSRGYVGFAITAGHDTGQRDSYGNAIYTAPTLETSYSSDGVHWQAGQRLDTSADMPPLEVIRSVIEGPAGLLAVGWTGGCASEYVQSLWTSSDGETWQAVDTKSSAALISLYAVTHVSGGAPGYVGVAYKGTGVWISKDGRDWQTVSLRAAPFANSLVDDGTAIDGGFVLAGTTGTADCGATVQEPGDATPKPVFRTASVWWSADGSG